MNFTGYFLTTRNEFDFLHQVLYWEVNKTDPLTHWQNDIYEAANHTTVQEVVDFKEGTQLLTGQVMEEETGAMIETNESVDDQECLSNTAETSEDPLDNCQFSWWFGKDLSFWNWIYVL